MQTETPYQLIERLLAFRDSGKLDRAERDLLADACNMISRQTYALNSARGYVKLWSDDRDAGLLPTPDSLARAEGEIDLALSKPSQAFRHTA